MRQITEDERQQNRELAKEPSGIQKEIETLGWRDVARELRALGYVPTTHASEGEFVARDDRDGRGPYVAAWLSKDPFPLDAELLRPPETPEARAARLEELLVSKPYVEAFHYRAPNPANPGPTVYGVVLADHIKLPDGSLQKVVTRELSATEAEAAGFPIDTITGEIVGGVLTRHDQAVAAAESAKAEKLKAELDRDVARQDYAEMAAQLKKANEDKLAAVRAAGDLAVALDDANKRESALVARVDELTVPKEGPSNPLLNKLTFGLAGN